jgi:streptogramin lyase
VDGGGNVYITGESGATWQGDGGASPIHPYTGDYDICVLKLNSSGAYQWHTFYGSASEEEDGYGIAVDGSSNVYITGRSRATWQGDGNADPLHPYSGGNDDIFVLKLNSAGAYQWHTFYGSARAEIGYGIAVDGSRNVYITGVSLASWGSPLHPYSGSADICVLKLNSSGAYQWHTFYGSADDEYGRGIAVAGNGNVYVTGPSYATWQGDGNADPLHPYSSGGDIFVLKLGAPASLSLREYRVPTENSQPYGITADSGNRVWFTELAGNKIGRLTLAGGAALSVRSTLAVTLTEYAIPTAHSTPSDIVLGPDGNLWFTEYGGDKIGRITPAGAITEYPLPQAGSAAIAIAVGPDGNLWFCEEDGNRIGKMNTSGTLLAEYNVPTANSGLNDIVAGPDGALWFTEYEGQKIGRITTNGTITEYTVDAKVFGLALGPDGNLWFTETMADQVGRITPAGVVTEFDLPGDANGPQGITAGPFNSLWVVANFSNKVLRVLPSGTVLSEYTVPTSASGAVMIATDSSGALWFTEMGANQIGQLTPSGGTLYLPLVLRNR